MDIETKRWLLAASLAVSMDVQALSLGHIKVNSDLAQPLLAEIPIPAAREVELDRLHVGLASPKVYMERGVPVPDPSLLRFRVSRKDDGTPYIIVRSTRPIMEPAFSFFVEASWQSGHLVRGYDVLLDPPGHRQMHEQGPQPEPVADEMAVASVDEVETPVEEVLVEGPFVETFFDSHSYGPTQAHDTLSEIAYRLRPDPEMSLQQVMMALFRQNPEAFLDSNINRLKAGYVLKLKDESGIVSMSKEDAAREVESHSGVTSEGRPDEAPVPLHDEKPETDHKGEIIRSQAPLDGDPQAALVARMLELARLQQSLYETEALEAKLRKDNGDLHARIRMLEKMAESMVAQLDVGG